MSREGPSSLDRAVGGCVRRRNRRGGLALVFVGLALASSLQAHVNVFGPKTYTRTAGAPDTFHESFSITLLNGTFTLHVVNGDASGNNRISSGTIDLNGINIIKQSDFNQNVATIDRAVTVNATNTLDIRLTSSPGSFISVSIIRHVNDTTPPVITITQPQPGQLFSSSPVTVAGTVTDSPAGVASVQVNGAPVVLSNGAFTASVALTPGSNTITVQATDNEQNTGTQSVTVIFSPPPIITLDAPLPVQVDSSPLTIRGAVSSIAGLASFSVNGAPVPVTGGRFSSDVALSFGDNPIALVATDVSGLSARVTGTVILDAFFPIIAILSPDPNQIFGSPAITVTGRVVGIRAGVASLLVNGAPASLNGNLFQAQLNLVPGPNTITADVTDRIGRTSRDTRQVILDSAPPQVAITSPADRALINTSFLTVSGTVTDDAGVQSVTINGQFADLNGTLFSGQVVLPEGPQTLSVIATDTTGKQATAGRTVVIDTTPPTLGVTSPKDGDLTNGDTVTVAGDVSDANGVGPVTLNGHTVTLTGGHFSEQLVLQEGSNPIALVAQDVAGNVTTANLAVTRYSAPTVTIASPADLTLTSARQLTVTGTVSDATATVRVNGISATVVGNTFSAISVPLSEGGNLLTAAATDSHGHIGTFSITVVQDVTPPRVVIRYPVDGSTVASSPISVSGLVNDIVMGTVNEGQASVTVNGVVARVSNRTFVADGIVLAPGNNLLNVVALDALGNQSQAQVTVRLDSSGLKVSAVSGDRQSAAIGTLLPQPLAVRLTDASGQPVAGKTVIFALKGNDGSLDGGLRQLSILTGADGQAQAHFTLGTRAGVCNQVVEASASGFAGPVSFCADALPGPVAHLVADSGTPQVGITGQPLPRPLVAVATDAGFNRLPSVPVQFRVVEGGGFLAQGAPSLTVVTDSDGRVGTTLTTGSAEGVSNNVVQASIPGAPNTETVAFVSSAKQVRDVSQTSVSGVILDNSNVPIPGITVRIEGTALTAVADAQGQFRITGAPVGTVKLFIDGSSSTRQGIWPNLEFMLLTISGQDNTIGMPIFLLPIDVGRGLFIDETHGGTLTFPEIPGFSMAIPANSVTFPDGTRRGVVSVTVVHPDKVPMVPQFGQQPRFIVTIQPAGAKFNPPAQVTFPNLDGLSPGRVTEMYSFDHDLGSFVSIGPGTVSDDGSILASNPGVGILKAGWHCGGNPSPSGECSNCGQCRISLAGVCDEDPLKELTSCNDGLFCTQDDKCHAGNCSGTPIPDRNLPEVEVKIAAGRVFQNVKKALKLLGVPEEPTLDISYSQKGVEGCCERLRVAQMDKKIEYEGSGAVGFTFEVPIPGLSFSVFFFKIGLFVTGGLNVGGGFTRESLKCEGTGHGIFKAQAGLKGGLKAQADLSAFPGLAKVSAHGDTGASGVGAGTVEEDGIHYTFQGHCDGVTISFEAELFNGTISISAKPFFIVDPFDFDPDQGIIGHAF